MNQNVLTAAAVALAMPTLLLMAPTALAGESAQQLVAINGKEHGVSAEQLARRIYPSRHSSGRRPFGSSHAMIRHQQFNRTRQQHNQPNFRNLRRPVPHTSSGPAKPRPNDPRIDRLRQRLTPNVAGSNKPNPMNCVGQACRQPHLAMPQPKPNDSKIDRFGQRVAPNNTLTPKPNDPNIDRFRAIPKLAVQTPNGNGNVSCGCNPRPCVCRIAHPQTGQIIGSRVWNQDGSSVEFDRRTGALTQLPAPNRTPPPNSNSPTPPPNSNSPTPPTDSNSPTDNRNPGSSERPPITINFGPSDNADRGRESGEAPEVAGSGRRAPRPYYAAPQPYVQPQPTVQPQPAVQPQPLAPQPATAPTDPVCVKGTWAMENNERKYVCLSWYYLGQIYTPDQLEQVLVQQETQNTRVPG